MIGRVQQHLEAIYGMECPAKVESFVVDKEVAEQLGSTAGDREQLFVHEAEDGLDLALYLEPSLLARLER